MANLGISRESKIELYRKEICISLVNEHLCITLSYLPKYLPRIIDTMSQFFMRPEAACLASR